MQLVIGLLLVFFGLLIGYLVLTGRLPSSSLTPTATGGATSPQTSGTGFSASGSSVTGI